MKTVIVSCQMIKDELLQAMKETGCGYEILWLDQGLHDTPKKLKAAVQQVLDGITGYDRVLLTLGDCGGGTAGLKAGDYELIMPRMDDCITLLLGSMERRREISARGVYYLSNGWLTGNRNLLVEYEYSKDKYGEETAEMIMNTMFHNYHYLGLLDSGASDYAYLEKRTEEVSRLFHLEPLRLPATLDWLEQFLTGPYPEDRFLITAPGGTTPEQICG